VWLSLLGLAAIQGPELVRAFSGGSEERLALLVLVLTLGVTWIWSFLDAAGHHLPGARTWGPVGREFRRNRMAVLGVWIVVAITLCALLAPLVAPFDPAAQGSLVQERLLPPSPEHVLGTDRYARDVLSRILWGGRVSLAIGFLAVAIAVSLGTSLGAVSGYLGGWADEVIMRLVDVVLSFPRLVLLITVVALFQSSMLVVVLVLGLTLWPSTARLVRGEVLSLREREFVQAARGLGYSGARVVFRHLVPNALAPVIVAATLGIGNTIVLEAGLSFLGLGVQPPTPSWGGMIADHRSFLLGAWWASTFPGLALVVTVVAFNLVGDGLRDALDPKLRGEGRI
jgi:peptide/nickel transport system permease protein